MNAGEDSSTSAETPAAANTTRSRGGSRRRGFLKSIGIAGAAFSASPLMPISGKAFANTDGREPSGGDVAILQLLAAVELVEADLWQQYAELGGVSEGTQNPYQLALHNLDSDGSQ